MPTQNTIHQKHFFVVAKLRRLLKSAVLWCIVGGPEINGTVTTYRLNPSWTDSFGQEYFKTIARSKSKASSSSPTDASPKTKRKP